MAYFTSAQSPGTIVREIDLTTSVPGVATQTGAFVGNFRWGPVDEPTYVSSETNLVDLFATPDTNNTVDFHSAAYFTKYSNSLLLTRAVDGTAANAFDSDNASSFASTRSAPVVKNDDHFDTIRSALDSDGHSFIAKYPSAMGNSIQIQICPASTADSDFDNWSYGNNFTSAPGTSDFALGKSASDDEVHVAVIDADGAISGSVGTVLESWPFLSLAPNAKTADGSTNYISDVLNNQSNFLWSVGAENIDSDYRAGGSGTDAESGVTYSVPAGIKTINLVNGANSGALGTAEYAHAYDLISDVDEYDLDFIMSPPVTTSQGAANVADTIISDLNEISELTRKDCIVVASPPKHVVITNDPVTDTIAFAKLLPSTSYTFLDNNWLKVFDKYNDQEIYIPANTSTAGLMALSERNTAAWFSPAFHKRGRYFGIIDIAAKPKKADRDRLYRANVNPIAVIPGDGILLYGDKTMLRRPSAFDRINVRRLFLVMEKSISKAATRAVLGEFNDEFTRAQFINTVEPFLREIKGRRGLTDFQVVCDETNNTPEIIDRNEFVATIKIKPARSINFITLNFVAVRTGVSFEEIPNTF